MAPLNGLRSMQWITELLRTPKQIGVRGLWSSRAISSLPNSEIEAFLLIFDAPPPYPQTRPEAHAKVTRWPESAGTWT